MIKYLFIGSLVSVGWYAEHEVCEIIHRKIHTKCKDQNWYRKLYSQPTPVDLQKMDAGRTIIYGFRPPEKTA